MTVLPLDAAQVDRHRRLQIGIDFVHEVHHQDVLRGNGGI